MRITVDEKLCQGHGLCYFESDALFELRDIDGKSVVQVDEVPEHLIDVARVCADGCPERAIRIDE